MTTLTTINPGTVRGSLTEVRARQLVDAIKTHVESVGALLVELYEGQGWIALGYGSWREMAVAQFGKSTGHVYRLLNAAQVEMTVFGDSPNGRINERVARELDTLPPEHQAFAYHLATFEAGGEQPTARQTRAAVQVTHQLIAARGNVSIGGVSKNVLHGALTEEEYESIQRQYQHIEDSQRKKHGVRILTFPAQVYELNRADPEKDTMTTLVLVVPSEALLPFEVALKDSGTGVVQCSVYKDETALIDETVRSI